MLLENAIIYLVSFAKGGEKRQYKISFSFNMKVKNGYYHY